MMFDMFCNMFLIVVGKWNCFSYGSFQSNSAIRFCTSKNTRVSFLCWYKFLHCNNNIFLAEEVGLRGSGQMAQDYKSRNVNVYAMMQQDCIGYNPKNLSTIAIIRESGTSATLTAFLRKLVPEYLNLSIKDTSAPGGSDHQSWTRAGYHTCIPSEAEWNSGAWHTSRDTIDRLNIKHMTYFVKLGVAFAVELSLAQ